MKRALGASKNEVVLVVPYMGNRRSPPVQSKALPRIKRQKLSHVSDDEAQIPNPTQVAALQQNDSRGGGESASKWFDALNENVEIGHHHSAHISGM